MLGGALPRLHELPLPRVLAGTFRGGRQQDRACPCPQSKCPVISMPSEDDLLVPNEAVMLMSHQVTTWGGRGSSDGRGRRPPCWGVGGATVHAPPTRLMFPRDGSFPEAQMHPSGGTQPLVSIVACRCCFVANGDLKSQRPTPPAPASTAPEWFAFASGVHLISARGGRGRAQGRLRSSPRLVSVRLSRRSVLMLSVF